MSKITFRPLADRVLVEPYEAENKTLVGIIIPDAVKEKPQKGRVVAVGPGTQEEEMLLFEDDIILFGKYSGTELLIDEMQYLIMKVSDVYGLLIPELETVKL